jgi:hypothetical protein
LVLNKLTGMQWVVISAKLWGNEEGKLGVMGS